jgi:hypothetical protein
VSLLWEPVADMPATARARVREQIPPVAAAAFDATSLDFWRQQWSEAQLDQFDVLNVAVDELGAVVGWVAGRRARWGRRRVLYAASAGVAPDLQGGGVSANLWRRVVERELRRSPLRPLFVVLRTGNPVVYDAWLAAAGDQRLVHPHRGKSVPVRVQRIAQDVAAYLGQSNLLDVTTLRVTDAYQSTPEGLWRHRPRSRDQLTNQWFDTTLGPVDAFLVVARFHAVSQWARGRRRRRGR